MGKKCTHCNKNLRNDYPSNICSSCANVQWKLEKQASEQKKKDKADLLVSLSILAICSLGGVMGFINNSTSFAAFSSIVGVGAVCYIGLQNYKNKA